MMRSLKNLLEWFRSDGRHFQIISHTTFLSFGILFLSWDADSCKFLAAFAGALGAQMLAIYFRVAPINSLKSAVISALGLCILFKANSAWLFLFAALFAIGQKFLIRINGKHIWNPTDFGMILLIILGGDAWVSPGQWGSSAVVVFIIGTAGLAVLSKVKRLETGLVFILTLAILEYTRTILYLGWESDVFFHKLSSGSLWLFSFFMITDPMTSPNSRIARTLWAMLIAVFSFILANFYYVNVAPMWVLFFATPFTPLFDMLFKASAFHWISKNFTLPHHKFIRP